MDLVLAGRVVVWAELVPPPACMLERPRTAKNHTTTMEGAIISLLFVSRTWSTLLPSDAVAAMLLSWSLVELLALVPDRSWNTRFRSEASIVFFLLEL